MLVEAALTSRAIYLQAGKPGDRVKHDPGRPKLLVELNATGFQSKWDDLYLQRMVTVFAERLGKPRREARPYAEDYIRRLRMITEFRMPQR